MCRIRRRFPIFLATVMTFTATASAQIDTELTAYVTSRRKVMDDPSRPIAEREKIALETAATLDRAAWNSDTPRIRRAAWSEARSVLDGFTARNPGHPNGPTFVVQGAVYLWAEGQSWSRGAESGDAESRARASSAFDGVADRLRPVVKALDDSDTALAQNARYRLARSLLDRSRLDPDRPAAPALRDDALKIIAARPYSEPSLVGFAELLRADLLAEAGRFDQARAALNASAKSPNPPPVAERLAVSVPIAAGRKEFAQAAAEIDASKIPAAEKTRLRLRLALAQRKTLEAGVERAKIEAEGFRLAAGLRTSDPQEFAGAIRELARAIDEPAATAGPETWALLAEGAAALGQFDRASRLDVIAAAKAEGRGDLDSARRWRFRAAAISFAAGKYARADLLFARVLEDPDAGPLRPRAGMLRALSRGRGVAAGVVGMTGEGYRSALTSQIRDFPDDPTTGEARWLLGQVRQQDRQPAEAEKLWSTIPRAHPRWLDSRLAIISVKRSEIEERRLVDEPSMLDRMADAIRATIDSAKHDARDDFEKTELEIQRIGLDLTPGAGDPNRGREAVERLRLLPLDHRQRAAVNSLQILALAASERFLEAEKVAANSSGTSDERLKTARQLDRWASSAKADRVARRIGGIEKILADRMTALKDLSPIQIAEIRLRRARGRMLAGDFEGARGIVKDWTNAAAELPEFLVDLADLYAQVGENERAIAVYRLSTQKLTTGSPLWLVTRLGHARALAAAGQSVPAKRILEGTALLHPELGGPKMRQEFTTLQAKLDRR